MAKVTQARIYRLIDKWRPRLDLEGWSLFVRFDERKLLAYCDACTAYAQATLGFNLRRINREKVIEEEIVVHEMLHAVAAKASERTITQLTRCFLRAYGIEYSA